MLESSPQPVETPEPTAELEPPDPNKTYWAALDPEQFCDAVYCRIREYYQGLQETGVLTLWQKAHQAFYSLSESGQHEASRVVEFGTEGEMLGVRSNQARSIVRYIHTSATANRPAWHPKATSASAKSLAQVPTAKTLLTYYFVKKGVELALNSAALRSLLYGKGYVWETWDVTAGPKGPEGKALGDVVVKALSPDDVVCDPDRARGEHDWFAIRTWRNRFDIAAQYAEGNEEFREEILNVEDEGVEAEFKYTTHIRLSGKERATDDVAVWHVLHRDTPACPGGRYTILTGKDKVLFDGPLPFADLHVYEMCPEEFLEAGNLGYGAIWEIMGLQQVYDGMLSTAVSNFDAMGQNDVLLPDGMNIGYEELREGLGVIRYPQGQQPPKVLEKFQLADAFFKLYEGVREDMQLALGVNNVVRGDPEASLKSGAALALIQAQAVHFQTGFNGEYIRLIEKTGTGVIQLLKKFAEVPRLAAITGAYEQDALKAFKADDISDIDRVEVDAGNPIFNTVAGKVNLADQFLERGMLTRPEQYYQVLETGRLEPITDPGRRSECLIREENETLMRGPAVTPAVDALGMPKLDPATGQPLMQVEGIYTVLLQDHVAHIQGHSDVLNSPEALADAAVTTAVLTHIQEHLRQWKSADPDLLAALNIPLPMSLGGAPPGQDQSAPTQDPAKGKNQQKSAEAAEKKTGAGAPGAGRGPKLPEPAKPPAGAQ